MEFTSLGKRLVEKVWSWDNISLFCSHCNPCLFILCVHCVRWSVCVRMRVLVCLHFKKMLMGFLQEGSITKGIKSRCKTAGCRIHHWFVKNKHSFYNHRDRWSLEKMSVQQSHLPNWTQFLPSFKGINSHNIIFKWDSDHPQGLCKIQPQQPSDEGKPCFFRNSKSTKTAVLKVHASADCFQLFNKTIFILPWMNFLLL